MQIGPLIWCPDTGAPGARGRQHQLDTVSCLGRQLGILGPDYPASCPRKCRFRIAREEASRRFDLAREAGLTKVPNEKGWWENA